MKRRNFILSLATVVCGAGGCKCSTLLRVEKPDPYEFIKINTYKNSYVIHNNFKFYQDDNNIWITQYKGKIIPHGLHVGAINNITVPIDFKTNQKSKNAFITELKKYKGEWNIFELIADNGKSNIYAQMKNSENNEKAWGV